MTESEYHQRVDAILLSLEEQIDAVESADIDYESAEGILTVLFEDGSKIILNKQEPLLQLWVATLYNGHHFERRTDVWIDNRTDAEFWSFISEAMSRQAHVEITFTGPN